MSHRTKRVLFSTPIWMLLEFFLLKYIFLLYGGVNDWYTFCITVILGLMQTVPMLFEEKKSRIITRFITRIFGVWEWFIVMLLISTTGIYIIDLFIHIPTNVISIIYLIIILIGAYAYYNAHHIVFNDYILKLDNIKEDINIVHISDIHFGSVRHEKLLINLRDRLNEIPDADIIIVSGDIADGSCIVEEDDFMALSEVKTPIVFTSGNHDYYPGIDNVHRALKKAGVHILENDSVQYKDLNIYGLSYSFGDIEYSSREELEESISDDLVNILVFHVPYNWGEFSKLGFDIQLSGHTHGGQFYPIKWFGNLVYNHYNLGLYKERLDGRNKYLNVTPGVGSMDIPMRWGTHSQIDILKLRGK